MPSSCLLSKGMITTGFDFHTAGRFLMGGEDGRKVLFIVFLNEKSISLYNGCHSNSVIPLSSSYSEIKLFLVSVLSKVQLFILWINIAIFSN